MPDSLLVEPEDSACRCLTDATAASNARTSPMRMIVVSSLLLSSGLQMEIKFQIVEE